MFQAVRKAQEVVQAVVPHIYVCTFVGDLELHHDRSPFNHDVYPMVPFIGYLDRYNCPYGVPAQVEGQQEEVNKRRSMALALLQKRRVIVESDAVQGGQTELELLYREANKLDGFMVVKPNKMNAVKVMEDVELFPPHVNLMDRSSTEIQEIAGTNAEFSGYESNARSGVAIDKRMQQSATVIAPLFDNLRRSQKILGYQIGSNMQQFWTKEKVLRVTDRLTGADRFVALNQVVDQGGGMVSVKNDITQGKYDYVVTEIPRTDTIRELYLNMIIEWVKRTPPEAVPVLLTVAFEIADLPNKDKILAKIKPMLGVDPREEQMDPEQVKQKAIQELEAQQQSAAEAAKLTKQGVELEQRKVKLAGDQIMARIKEIDERLKIERARAVNEIKMGAKEKAAPAKEKADPALQASLDMVKSRQATDLKKEEMATQASLDMVKSKQESEHRKEEAEHGSKLSKDEEKTKAASVLKQRQEDSKLKIKEEKAKPKPKPAAKSKGK